VDFGQGHFSLSLRGIELILAECGVMVTRESTAIGAASSASNSPNGEHASLRFAGAFRSDWLFVEAASAPCPLPAMAPRRRLPYRNAEYSVDQVPGSIFTAGVSLSVAAARASAST
jgi:hypothetical protein